MSDVVTQVVSARRRELVPGLSVGRVLPYAKLRALGPFVFLDQMGPTVFAPGERLAVAPHPHIGLSTLTYLYEGRIRHRDSLGSDEVVAPLDVNWMTAGSGVVHSERSHEDDVLRGSRLHGLQLWVALPREHEAREASFEHHDRASLPERAESGVVVRLVAGTLGGEASPVRVFSPLVFADLAWTHDASDASEPNEATFEVPDEHDERGVYVVSGAVTIDGARFEEGSLVVLAKGARARVSAAPGTSGTRAALLGGAPLDGPRHIDWNFVASDREAVAAARTRWIEDAFPKVPGDPERIPYPTR